MKGREKLGIWSTAKSSKSSQSQGQSKSSQQLHSRSEENAKVARSWFSWPWLAALLVIISGGVGFTATSLLLKLPQVPDCPKIFWPLASATKRLYCAQIEAEKKTLDGWLRAISLVGALPDDHPLRPDVDRQVEEWAAEIMDLAEGQFQAGQLKEAIATAQRIPRHIRADSVIEEEIEGWQSTWSEAEKIYAQAERQLQLTDWKEAFRAAVRLTHINNRYWAVEKYQETVDKIEQAREEGRQVDAAFADLRRGGLDNWLSAIDRAEQIGPKSYVYKEAQDLIEQTKDELLKHAQKLVKNRRWEELIKVSNRLPVSLDLEEQADDWYRLASAGTSANTGTVLALEVAIEEAQRIETTSSVYTEAQDLIERWHLEIEDLGHLVQARDIARPGDINSLAAAISEAQSIPQYNPLYQEAQAEISGWRSTIETIEDQPIIDRARAIASRGTIGAWESAIAEARLVGRGRALYPEAQGLIDRWRGRIERQEDQPYLDRAISLAYAKNYPAAIETAQQIGSGRVLYDEARTKIRAWRQEIQAQELLEQAYLAARLRTTEALTKAIDIAQQIPSATEVGPESRQLINRWGRELLAIARDSANYSLQEAISVASKIPAEADAYQSAQADIARWEERLKPPEPPVMPQTPLLETNIEEL